MADEVFKISGVVETIEALNGLPATLVGLAGLRSLQAGAAPMRDALQDKTPYSGLSVSGWTARSGARLSNSAVDSHGGRGALRENIKTKIVLDSRLRGGTADVGFMTFDLAFVADVVDRGHRIVTHRPGLKDTGKRVPPHPFLLPAFEASWERALEAFANTFAATVNRGVPGFPDTKKLYSSSSSI